MRKFARVSVVETSSLPHADDLDSIGPDPLNRDFTYKVFKGRLLKRPAGKIKQALMEQKLIAGIGNIYSDEILWRAGVHPLSIVKAIPEAELKKMYEATGETLKRGIDFGGDSMSDYRNILGEPGKFQSKHEAYRRTGKPCNKKGCPGVIERLKIGGRSGHFCSVHQKLFLPSKHSK
jgi:formamidopyrimidine-DNA glycosylase